MYGQKPVMFFSGYAPSFLPTPFMLYLCPKNNSTNHFELCASSKQYYVPTLCLDMSDLLPVTPTIQTAKPEITISQQLLSRFRSSFQGMKPYPYANEIIIYNCTCWLVVKLGTPQDRRLDRSDERQKEIVKERKGRGGNVHPHSFVFNPSLINLV